MSRMFFSQKKKEKNIATKALQYDEIKKQKIAQILFHISYANHKLNNQLFLCFVSLFFRGRIKIKLENIK